MWFKILKKILGKIKGISRFLILGLILFYLGIGLIGVVLVYDQKKDDRFTRTLSLIYPYPAALTSTETIWLKDFYRQKKFLERFSQRSSQPLPEDINNRLLEQLIERRIVKKEAKRGGLEVSSKEIVEQVNQAVKENGGESQFKAMLTDLYSMRLRDFSQLVEDQLYKDKVKNELLVKIKVRHILVSDQEKAKEIKAKLEGGAKFEDVAKESSQDQSSRDQGGELGSFNLGDGLIKEFEEVAFKLEPGKLSDPVKTSFGWHIIRIDERKGKVLLSYNAFIEEAKKRYHVVKLFK